MRGSPSTTKRPDLTLDEWQQEVLAYEGNICLCTGRQIGKTMIMSRKAAERMLKQETHILIASLTEDQAKLIIIMILDYLQAHAKDQIAKGRHKPTQNKIVLKNGSSAIARPVGNTGDALRGFTADVLILDEVSRFSQLIITAAKPTLLSTGGDLWLCSTPFGKKYPDGTFTFFYECFLNSHNRFKVFYKSSEECIQERPISEAWTEKKRKEALEFLEDEKKSMSYLQYGQEYLGLFLDELRQYFSDDLINRVCVLKRRTYHARDRNYSLGVDIARMGDDPTAYAVLDATNKEQVEQVEAIILRKQLTTQTEQRIIAMDRTYDFARIYIDAGAGTLGVSIFDHLLAESQTRRKIVAVNNRTMVMDREGKKKQKMLKEDLYDHLLNLMEKDWIRLLDDEAVRHSLASVQWEIPKEGNARIRIFGDNTHMAEALIRAACLTKDKGLNIWVRSIRV